MRKTKLLSLATAMMLLATLVAPMSASAASIGEVFPCVQDEGKQNQLEFGSDILVFKNKDGDGDANDWSIRGHDMASGQTFDIFDDPDTENNPSVHGDIAVWMRVDPDDDEHDIWGKNLSTGDYFPICTREGEQCNPFVWGDWVVYVDQSDDDPRSYALYKYNLKTGVESLVNDTAFDQRCPVVNGQYVAYHSQDTTTGSGNDEVWVTELSTGVSSLCATGSGMWEVSMGDGDVVVWVEYRDGMPGSRAVAYDISTGVKTYVGVDSASVNAEQPDVYGDIVVWSDDRNSGDTDRDIFMHDLSTGIETTVCAASGEQSRPRIWGSTIAWVGCGSDTGTEKDIFATRIGEVTYGVAGTNRFLTAVEASQRSFPGGANDIVIANGETWPDALAASALAGVIEGPILLASSSGIPAETLQEIARLGARNAYIVGGTGVIPADVEAQLDIFISGPITRLGGTNRYETAELISAEVVRLQGSDYDGTAFLATGMNYADSLAAAPLAAANGWPIFLAPTAGPLASTTAAMADVGVTEVVILGGKTVMASKTHKMLERGFTMAAASLTATRIAGSNRYATAAAVAQFGVDTGLDWDGVALTNGLNFPDALAGGPLQGISGSVVLLTDPNTLSPATAAKLTDVEASISAVKYLGGPNAVTAPVRAAVGAILD